MTYVRVRVAVLIAVALVLLAGPAVADLQGQPWNGSAQPPPTAAVAAAPAPEPTSTRTRSAPAPVKSSPSRSPAHTPPATSAPANPGPPDTSSPSTDPALGPGGSVRRTGSEGVALTFDDGPDPVNTPLILDVLRQHGVKATFCLVGFRARDDPDLVRRIAGEGHTLCNHSWQHLFNLAKRPPEYIRADLVRTNETIRAAAPGARIGYFRAPGGYFTAGLSALASGLGMAPIYWEVDPRDWDHRGATDQAHIARVIGAVQKYTRPGSIVLSHDNGQPDTIEAYRTLLPWLKARFNLVALPAGRDKADARVAGPR
jgi:peptidoglycan/xylan/chitin deacetylase (PgdA/CDA1 family)